MIFVTGASGSPNDKQLPGLLRNMRYMLIAISWGKDGVMGRECTADGSVQRRNGELGGYVDIATVCAGGVFHLGDIAHRCVLLAALAARRDLGPDRPERSSWHRGGRCHQPSRP